MKNNNTNVSIDIQSVFIPLVKTVVMPEMTIDKVNPTYMISYRMEFNIPLTRSLLLENVICEIKTPMDISWVGDSSRYVLGLHVKHVVAFKWDFQSSKKIYQLSWLSNKRNERHFNTHIFIDMAWT